MRHQPEYNILLVEDNPGHAELINRAFETESHCHLMVTATIEQARLLIDDANPDLIITDLKLPDGHGTELVNPAGGCPTIVMTSFSDEKIAVNAIKSGAADYIVKSQETMSSLPRTASRILREWRLVIDQKLARERQQRLTAILEATPDLICIADLDGFLTYINQSGRALLGFGKNEDLSRIRLADFHAPADARKILGEGIPCAMREGIWTGETTFQALDGAEILTSQVLISHRNQHGEIEFFSTIARDIRHLRAAEEQVEYLAYYDTLTGLPNRNELAKRLEMEVSRVRRHRNHGALLFIDLDNFKYINDSMGHPAGDELLQQMAHRLRASVRGDDTVARLGGDEFIVILSSLSEDPVEAVSHAREIGTKIGNAIALECRLGEVELHITASIGISMITAEHCDGDDLLRFADTAMYQAKRGGRNRLEFFSESMSSNVTRQLELENQLRRALRENQFELYYQPLVDNDGQAVGAETLIRWNHPERGIVAPGEFLDVLESSGQIVEVGDWVFETALAQMTEWRGRGLWQPDFMLCVNVSPRQFNDKRFGENFHNRLERADMPSENIVMEVTEHNIIDNLEDAILRMRELIHRGVSFSLDDFGTGYSSLSHLKNLPVDHIKIDRAFVQDICHNPGDQAMIASILTLSNHLGLKVVAEGVEELEQFELLRKLGCQYYQGYYFSRPLSCSAMTDFLIDRKSAA